MVDHSNKGAITLKLQGIKAQAESKKAGPAGSLDVDSLRQLTADHLQTLKVNDTKDNVF